MILKILRNELKTCKISRYRIEQDTRVDKAVLSRIYHGESCGIETADILLRYFGYKIMKPERKRGRGDEVKKMR
jgi:hypothetical protein